MKKLNGKQRLKKIRKEPLWRLRALLARLEDFKACEDPMNKMLKTFVY